MSGASRMPRGPRLRGAVQAASLILFLWLLFTARQKPGADLPSFSGLFFWIDPLILVATFLAAHAVPVLLLSAIATILVTLVAGRVFCGWICPFGALHSAIGWVCDRIWPKSRKREHWSGWQRAKYYVLAGFIAMALLGGHWVTIFDPIVLLYRSTTAAVLPGLQWTVEESSTALFQWDLKLGPLKPSAVTEPCRKFLREHLFAVDGQAFIGSELILVVFVGLLAANAFRRRWWCRYACPTGALLGLLSIRPLLRRALVESKCTKCDLCSANCQGNAADGDGSGWRPSECFVCLNCASACRRNSLAFGWKWPWHREPVVTAIGLSRRAMIISAVGGVCTLWFFRSSPLASSKRLGYQARGLVFEPSLIRPPGARAEREFIQRCTACGVCIKVCPTGGLQPCVLEAGLEGLWTPRLVPQLGHCAYDCNLCGQVCPTQAITPLKLEEKKKFKLGLAAFDTTHCIPHAYGRDCMVCEECCPVPEKAIYFIETRIVTRTGEQRTVKLPHVDADLCIGCGVCENVCPLRGNPGIRVTNANESRNPANQPILTER